ncbi:MAG: hypothetical protein LBC59_04200 [Chitinispirillales bacterium]|nr:hypothetical protein [Chitinispirillales bacterium]
MKYSKKTLILPVVVVSLLVFGGCYTRIMSYQGEVTEAGSKGGAGCGECLEEVPYTGSRQVCVWERDFFGYPELRCYNTGYASSWLYFHNTPWWYRNSYGWRDTRGCPPYYYYDRIMGTCRYYGGSYSRPNTGMGGGHGGGSGDGAAKHEQAPARRNNRVVSPSEGVGSEPAAGSASTGAVSTPSAPMFSGGLKTLSPAPSPVKPPQPSVAEENSGQGMSKPQDGISNHAPSQPQLPQQTPPPSKKDDTPQGPPPRRNSRGM